MAKKVNDDVELQDVETTAEGINNDGDDAEVQAPQKEQKEVTVVKSQAKKEFVPES